MYKCPYCNKEMVEGNIYGDRYDLKWLPITKKLLLGIFARGGISLVTEVSKYGLKPMIRTYMCEDCGKFIINKHVETKEEQGEV